MENKDVLYEKSYKFAVRIVKLSQYLNSNKKEYVLSKQIMRSDTSIGALIREAKYAQSDADFLHKLTVSLKEANETMYWIDLLNDTGYLTKQMHQSLYTDINELISILVSSTKTLKTKQGNI